MVLPDQILICFLVLLNNQEPFSKGQDQQPLNQVAKSCSEASTKTPASSKDNDSIEKPAEAKKNKRERKEERQKNRKREKKELKLENHQDNSRSQKPKKRKKGQEADLEAAGERGSTANGSIGKKGKKKKGQGKQAGEEDANRVRGPKEDPSKVEMKATVGRRKRKHSIGTRPGSGVSSGGQAATLNQGGNNISLGSS